MIYVIINNHVALNAPHPSIYMEWEKQIPFIPEFILFYHSMSVVVVVLFMLPQSRFELHNVIARLLFIYGVSYTIFLLYPLQFGFERPPIEHQPLLLSLFNLLDGIDLPYNQCPSLHISAFVVYWFALRCYLKNLYLRTVVLVWFLLVGVSVLFIYQHHFLDIVGGVVVGLVAVWLFKERV